MIQLKKYGYPTAYVHPLQRTEKLSETDFPLVNSYALRNPEPLAILFDFLEGATGEAYHSSEAKMRTLGVAVGKLSMIPIPRSFLLRADALHFPPGEMIQPFLKTLDPASDLAKHPFVAKEVQLFESIAKECRHPRLPRAITHGDIFLDNCLWDEANQCVSSVLDFEEVSLEPAILDVAMTLLGCCFTQGDTSTLNVAWAKAFLEGYTSVRLLTSLEVALLPKMMDLCLISSSFWRFNQFAILHPELGLKDNYRELLQRGEKGDASFAGWWNLPETKAWRASPAFLHPSSSSHRTYQSTRGSPTAAGRNFEQVLFGGFASDGGLFVPSQLPRFSDLKAFSGLSYPALVKIFLRYFISDAELSQQEIDQAVDKALSTFSHPQVLPLVPLSPSTSNTTSSTSNIHIMEMFHGTTGAFKDLSMTIIGQLMQTFLNKHKTSANPTSTHKIIVVGTSGDTGSAAIHAVRDCPALDIVVLYPKGRVSRIQELQMVTEKKAHVFAVEGTSDDLDVPIKAVLNDHAFAAANGLCSINSINLARVAIQCVHFFYAYVQLVKKDDEEVVFAIPCGAGGDLVGAIMAREMGLPLKVVAAVNENDIMARVIQTGLFKTGESVFGTTSPSMDIQVPYNWERVAYYASGGDVEGVKQFMEQFEQNPKAGAKMDDHWLENLKSFLFASSVPREEVARITKETYQTSKYILDPHTAVGLQGYLNVEKQVLASTKSSSPHVVVLSTATPHKFSESVLPTLNLEAIPDVSKVFQGLEALKDESTPMPRSQDWEALLRLTITDIRKKHIQ